MRKWEQKIMKTLPLLITHLLPAFTGLVPAAFPDIFVCTGRNFPAMTPGSVSYLGYIFPLRICTCTCVAVLREINPGIKMQKPWSCIPSSAQGKGPLVRLRTLVLRTIRSFTGLPPGRWLSHVQHSHQGALTLKEKSSPSKTMLDQ